MDFEFSVRMRSLLAYLLDSARSKKLGQTAASLLNLFQVIFPCIFIAYCATIEAPSDCRIARENFTEIERTRVRMPPLLSALRQLLSSATVYPMRTVE